MLNIRKKDTATLSNILNEMVCKGLTLQQLRFFLVYLAKLNPKPNDPEEIKTEVTFSLDDYSEIIGAELNEKNIDKVTEDLMKIIVNIRPEELRENELEAVIKCPLFSECRLFKNKSDEKYYLTFECHKRAKDELFNLARQFTSIQVWNVLNLHSFIDSRIYMLLKQYKKIGERTIAIKELKLMLGMDENSYPEYKIFARDVLKKSQKSLKEKTDICFDYKAVGRPAHSIKFTILDNKDYELPNFLKRKKIIEIEEKNKLEQSDSDYNNYVKSYNSEKTEKKGKEDKYIRDFRALIDEINPDWEIKDEQIIDICSMISDYLFTVPQYSELEDWSKDTSRLDFYYAVLRRASAENAVHLYKYLISQWDRYKYGDENGNGRIWVW